MTPNLKSDNYAIFMDMKLDICKLTTKTTNSLFRTMLQQYQKFADFSYKCPLKKVFHIFCKRLFSHSDKNNFSGNLFC